MIRTFLTFHFRTRRGALLLLGLLLAAAPARAQEVRVSTAAVPPPAEAPALDIKENAVQLSLDDAVRIALQQNLGLVAERYSRTQRRLGITQSLGIYDLLADATLLATDNRSPNTNQVAGTQSNSQSFNFSFRQRVPTGGDVSVGWTSRRNESNSTFQQALTYSPGLTFSYDQPLLRDFGRAFNERNIIIARTNSEISGQEFERQVTLTTQDVVNAYWALVNAREQLGVAQQSLQLARDLHDRNRIQVEVGTMAPLELTQSEAAIATRQEDIIRSTSNVGDAEDNLRRLLNLPPGPLWETPIVPTTPPVTERVAINVDQAIQTAYAERPELRQQALQLEQARRDSEFFRNQLKPTLDLHLDYGLNGGDPSFSEALSQLYGFDFRTWTAQVRFAYPIQNRAARAQSAIANLDVDRFQTLFDQQRVLISTEVRRAARAVETAAQQIEAARISREFQEKNVEAEKKRYENGMSSSFQITQIQDDLTQARSREVAATVNYRTALAEFYRATGRLLDEHGVAIDDPADPDYMTQRYSFSRAPLPGEVR